MLMACDRGCGSRSKFTCMGLQSYVGSGVQSGSHQSKVKRLSADIMKGRSAQL